MVAEKEKEATFFEDLIEASIVARRRDIASQGALNRAPEHEESAVKRGIIGLSHRKDLFRELQRACDKVMQI